MHFIDFFGPQIAHLGYWAYALIFLISFFESTAFVGLFVPGTTFAIFTGFMASQGVVDLESTLILVALGGICGDALSYTLGKRGTGFFSPRSVFFKQDYLEKGKEFFKRFGDTSVVLARFVGPLRPVVPFVAGLVGMKRSTFFLFNIIGGIAASFTYTLVGYYFGVSWEHIVRVVGRIGLGAIMLIVLALLAGYIVREKALKERK